MNKEALMINLFIKGVTNDYAAIETESKGVKTLERGEPIYIVEFAPVALNKDEYWQLLQAEHEHELKARLE